MREYLFRGKRKDDGEWVEGDLIQLHDGSRFIVNNAFGACFDASGNFINTEYPFVCEVDPETVGQYTGLKDKNGVKIFEGDIVNTDITRPYLIVEYRDGCFMFNCNDGGKDYYDIMLPILKEPQEVYEYGEVIGNIHDNPDMLKEGGEE